MEITSLEKGKEKCSFLIKDVTASFANELRRVMVEDVPVMAIEEVEFKENDSILYDEIVAHRLGLLPLTTDLKSYDIPSECSCKGALCAKCSVKLSLKEKGPCIICASDIKSKDSAIKPAFPDMIIVNLLKDQKLEFVATAILGTGKEHAKFSSSLVHFTYKPILTVNNKSDLIAQFREKYPPQIFDDKGNIQKEKINTPNLVDAVDGICEDIIKVEYKDDEFIFYIESFGQLSCKEIATKAAEILLEKLEDFSEKIKEE
jgi:DNA-directed RNA polymerase subunit D